jgi:hypothetical protein
MLKYKLIAGAENATPEELDELKRKLNIVLPSDYIFIALNYNHFDLEHNKDEEDVRFQLKHGETTGFDYCTDFKKIIDEITILAMYDETDGTELVKNFLPFLQTGYNDMILIGCQPHNANQIYYFDPSGYNSETKQNYILEKQADNYIDFLNNQVYIEKRE